MKIDKIRSTLANNILADGFEPIINLEKIRSLLKDDDGGKTSILIGKSIFGKLN